LVHAVRSGRVLPPTRPEDRRRRVPAAESLRAPGVAVLAPPPRREGEADGAGDLDALEPARRARGRPRRRRRPDPPLRRARVDDRALRARPRRPLRRDDADARACDRVPRLRDGRGVGLCRHHALSRDMGLRARAPRRCSRRPTARTTPVTMAPWNALTASRTRPSTTASERTT